MADLELACSAVLFDVDGTLVDSTPLVERAARLWAPRYGIDPGDYLAGAHGRRTSDRIADFLPAGEVRAATEHLDALEAELLMSEPEGRGAAWTEEPATREGGALRRPRGERGTQFDGVTALPGAVELLASLDGLPWALVTSMDTGQLEARAGAAGVPLPEVVVTAEDVTEGKPDPSGYLLAARRLGVDPARCVVAEDSPAGVRAGRSAGATVIAVVTSHPRERLAGADVIVPDLSAVRAVPGGLRVAR